MTPLSKAITQGFVENHGDLAAWSGICAIL